MARPRLRAVVLAAGRGERLRPLTDLLPKPLLPVAGRPILVHTLERLAALGVEATAINLHHLGEQVRRHLGTDCAGMPLTYSPETELLGTLGALGPLADFLRPAELVVVVNGDSLCRWPFRRLVRRHLRSGARATLLLSRRADPVAFRGGVGIDRRRRVVSLQPGRDHGAVERRRVFAGAQVFSPHLLEELPPAPSDLVTDLYEPLLAAGGSIGAVETGRRWHDLGTPGRFLAASLAWGRGWLARLTGGPWVAGDARVAAGARLRRTVVERRAAVEEGAAVSGSVLLPECRVGRGSRVENSIVGPGVALPPETHVAGRLVTVAGAATAPREGDSVIGGLVYSPLGGAGQGGRAR